ncbi:MAG: thioredoxin [Bacilli bacterium]|nr:thioredoxin [Bacilli bacterium]
MVKEIQEKEFREVVSNNKKVLVDCYADWCGPCKMLAPIVDAISEEMKGISFYKLNVDDCETIPREYGIMSIPTLLVFEDGNLKQTIVGLRSKSEIEDMLK